MTATVTPSTGQWRVSPRRPATTPAWWRDAIGALTWGSGLFVVALWISDRQVQGLTGGWNDAMDSLGRLTGLVATDLLLIQVLLMARIPVVERTYGQDELARRHRLVGFSSFTLMLLHVLLITLGYTGTDAANPFAEIWDLTLDYPGMLLALAGTLLLVVVAMTSLKRARKKLRYESWHLLHLYAYLGVGLALPHQLWTGEEFLDHRVATIYWWTLWAVAAGAILVFRLGMPVYRTLRHDLRVTEVVHEGPHVVSVWMRGRDLHKLPAAAGQFFTWRFLTGPGWTRGHPYSLSSAPDGDRLRITVRDLGAGSRGLAALRPGTRVAIEGPYGRLHAGVRTRKKVTLMAAGIGVTPLRALLEALPQGPGDVTLIYRAPSDPDLIFRAEIEELARARGAKVWYAVGPRVHGRSTWLPETAGHLSDAEALRRLVPDIAGQDVYLCGAEGWMDAAAEAARELGVPANRIHQERFSW